MGESIFDAAKRSGVKLSSTCDGKGTCGLCRVKIDAGEENLSPVTSVEKQHLGNTYFITHLRLSCQTRLTGGDVVVSLPAR